MDPDRHVVFVAPFLLRATLQFVAGAASLPGVALSLVSQDPAEGLPPELRARLTQHLRIGNALDLSALEIAIRSLQQRVGPVARILAALEQLQVPLARVRERLRIPGMGLQTAINFRDKSRMKDVLGQHGIPCARHRLVTSAGEALAFAEEVGWPLIVKPPDGAGSRATHRPRDRQELLGCLAEMRPSTAAPVLLEEFVQGDEHTFESVFVAGELRWHSISRYYPNPLHAMKTPWIQLCMLLPREIDHPHFDDIRRIATAANRSLGLYNGLSHLEWFRRPDRTIAVSEVGARPPGGQLTSMTGYAHDFDIHQAWARLMIFDHFDPPPRRYAAGTVFLRGQGRGRVRSIAGIEEIQRELGPLIVETKLPQLGQPSSGSYEGEGYVILRHPVTSVVEEALDRILATLRVEMG